MAELIGDSEFVAKFQPSSELPEIPAGVEQIPVSVDAKGNVIGDTSGIDPHILAQLASPEAQAQIREMYRASRYGTEEPRPIKLLNEGERRDFTKIRPQGMDAKTWKRQRKKMFRKFTKETIKVQRSIRNGH